MQLSGYPTANYRHLCIRYKINDMKATMSLTNCLVVCVKCPLHLTNLTSHTKEEEERGGWAEEKAD